MNRTLLRATFAVTFIALGAAVGWHFNQSPEITAGAYHNIHLGMSLAEAEAIIGKPGVYVTSERLFESLLLRVAPESRFVTGDRCEGDFGQATEQTIEEWYGPDGVITLGFDNNGFVLAKSFQHFHRRSFLERLRDLFPEFLAGQEKGVSVLLPR
jgi:hypothetical protein